MKENTEIFKTIVPEVVTYFSKTLILVATNTVYILSYITYNIFQENRHMKLYGQADFNNVLKTPMMLLFFSKVQICSIAETEIKILEF
ncbi:hypothetical protein AGMMS49921_08850 [Endomicrobiia bacterium]|nr:hypothetical protein AGMMS49921_08850 [Endomicrobiia bacterium]